MSINEEEPDIFQSFQLSSGFVLNTDMMKEKMEAENLGPSPASTAIEPSLFRRPINNPLFNGFGDNAQRFQVETLRMRRNGSPFLNRNALLFLPSHTRTSSNRIFQIKQEEGMNIAIREAMHERKLHIALQISQNFERCLNLNDNTMKPFTTRDTRIPGSPIASVIKKPRKRIKEYMAKSAINYKNAVLICIGKHLAGTKEEATSK
ncbi:P2R1A-PPP2R2A-interacting phosphatase regulator 1-like [Psammomys obesus]|uniref:P2R1A-PPP2R2A-interacting phosphatase regulator 1-like n=1 Tax=Psammomys obesus TaxID=48139 RepID=UPI00245286D6|nr:P2R1A-PPP2R2A-interacting phosphatase regulator 1-like [Psammomys obesus]